MKWRPICELPFDDVGGLACADDPYGIGWSDDVLLYVHSIPNPHHRQVVGRLEGGMWLYMDPSGDGCMGDIEGEPTHWMPLPAPPDNEAREEGTGNADSTTS